MNDKILLKDKSQLNDKIPSNYNRRKRKFKSRRQKRRDISRKNKMYIDKEIIKNQCRSMIVKCNKIYTNFEDKYYLTYSLETILADKAFQLFKLKDLNYLFYDYFNDGDVKIAKIDKKFNDYILNNSGYSKIEEKFYKKIKNIKRKYYMYTIYKDVYEKAEYYEEYKFAVLMKNKFFVKMFNSNEFRNEIIFYLNNKKISWSQIDEKFEKITYKLKAKVNLDKNDKNLLEAGILVKRLYIFFINKENELETFKHQYTKLKTIIADNQFPKDKKIIVKNAKNIINNSSTVNWEEIDNQIYKFEISKIKKITMHYDKVKYKLLQYFSELNKNYNIYLKNKTQNKKIQTLCDKNCLKICKFRLENLREYLSCAIESCSCNEEEAIANNNLEESNDEDILIRAISYLLLSITSVLLFIIMYGYIKRYQGNTMNHKDIEYELLIENEIKI